MRSTLPLILAIAALTLGACAADTANGFTPCGDFPSGPVECQPGQYCVDATFSECAPGCTSDVNCADGQTCVKAAGESVGDCVNAGGPGPGPTDPPMMSMWMAVCQGNCQDAAFFCEDGTITAPMAAACDAWCRDAGTSDSDRQAFSACVEAAFLSEAVCDEAACLP